MDNTDIKITLKIGKKGTFLDGLKFTLLSIDDLVIDYEENVYSFNVTVKTSEGVEVVIDKATFCNDIHTFDGVVYNNPDDWDD